MSMPSLSSPEIAAWRRRLPALFLGVALLLSAGVGLWLYRTQQRFAEVVGWQTRTYQVLRALDETMTAIQEVDATQRGYLVTGDAKYLKAHADARRTFQAQVGIIRALVRDNSVQIAPLDELVRLEEERQSTEDKVIQAKNTGSEQDVLQAIREGAGKGGMVQIREVHQHMVDEELRLLGFRERAVLEGRAATGRGMAALALAAALFVFLGLGMLLRLRRERSSLEAAWRRNTAILDSTPDFIGTMESGGRLTYLNPALRDLLGLDPAGGGDLEDWTIFRACTEDAARRLREEALPMAAQSGVWSGESAFRDASGRPVVVSQVILAHHDARGRVAAFSGIARDIQEQKATERLKNDFVSTVNHELRTPLTSIRGSLGLLLSGAAEALPEAVRPMVEIAHRNAERLSRIIDDILDLERLEAQGMEFHREPLVLSKLLAQAAETMGPYFREHGVRLDCALPSGQKQVLVDEGRFLQVLTNLLSNAAKFSPAGSAVEFRAASAAQEGWLRVEVANAGPGVPESFRPRIFQRFSQASSPTGERQGTGLGLSIAKTIVERLGGRIGFESEPGRTVFWVELPEIAGAGGATLDA